MSLERALDLLKLRPYLMRKLDDSIFNVCAQRGQRQASTAKLGLR